MLHQAALPLRSNLPLCRYLLPPVPSGNSVNPLAILPSLLCNLILSATCANYICIWADPSAQLTQVCIRSISLRQSLQIPSIAGDPAHPFCCSFAVSSLYFILLFDILHVGRNSHADVSFPLITSFSRPSESWIPLRSRSFLKFYFLLCSLNLEVGTLSDPRGRHWSQGARGWHVKKQNLRHLAPNSWHAVSTVGATFLL